MSVGLKSLLLPVVQVEMGWKRECQVRTQKDKYTLGIFGMEAKLAAYRAEKQRRWEAEQRRQRLAGLYQTATGLFRRQAPAPAEMEPSAAATEPLLPPSAAADGPPPPAELRDVTGSSGGALDWVILACKIGLYLTLFGICCHFQFGAAYVVVTAIPIIYFSTSTRGRRPGEASAYSVFNPNCEAIDGTLTGDQFQREIMYGPGAT
ncbi:SAYSvFN domain-containing protein 1-like isoform X2 [Amphibalanus amphitrite]|uniref:SAYSvFN domain-containing protein 1-like isoform X2 n=1 Tax=Amphibalanus amphitrite TaxID=1232801 RepID=UPI001C908231|nr:SAYSvFN domain-containing protein 1-like isoform X2 [Amphibalanus amphitrite]